MLPDKLELSETIPGIDRCDSANIHKRNNPKNFMRNEEVTPIPEVADF